jgi:uncharacterized protein
MRCNAPRSCREAGRLATTTQMKLILTSDLHQCIEKWGDLGSAVQTEKPRFVLIAGDLLPQPETVREQGAFFAEMAQHFRAMKKAGPVTVLTYLGNDDAHVLESLLCDLETLGLCVNLNGRVHREEGLVFCGMNRVRDYPFGYKHWCARDGDYMACPEQCCGQGLTLDGDYMACPEQCCGQGLTLDESGQYVRLDNLVRYLSSKPSLGDELDRVKAQLQPGEMERSVWMVHQPPSRLGMDICGDGRQVGSPTVLKFIEDDQPLLGCSGHIHESPHQPGGQWMARVGRTVWVQPGQMGYRLHYASLEIGDGLEVTGIRHSIFGDGGAGKCVYRKAQQAGATTPSATSQEAEDGPMGDGQRREPRIEREPQDQLAVFRDRLLAALAEAGKPAPCQVSTQDIADLFEGCSVRSAGRWMSNLVDRYPKQFLKADTEHWRGWRILG